MQVFEVLFLLVLAVGIVRLLLGPIHPRLTYSTIAVVGLGLMVLGVVIEGFCKLTLVSGSAFGGGAGTNNMGIAK